MLGTGIPNCRWNQSKRMHRPLTSPAHFRTLPYATCPCNTGIIGASGAADIFTSWNALSPLPGPRFSNCSSEGSQSSKDFLLVIKAWRLLKTVSYARIISAGFLFPMYPDGTEPGNTCEMLGIQWPIMTMRTGNTLVVVFCVLVVALSSGLHLFFHIAQNWIRTQGTLRSSKKIFF